MSDMIVKDHEIETVWGNADFGEYWNERKLIGVSYGKLTKKGKEFLWQELGSNL